MTVMISVIISIIISIIISVIISVIITVMISVMQKPLPLNQQQLSRAWDVSQRSTAADWNEWLRRLNVDLLKESPSPALRSCSALAQAYTPLARDLFHAAFVSCWHELSEQYQDSLVSFYYSILFHNHFDKSNNSCVCYHFIRTSTLHHTTATLTVISNKIPKEIPNKIPKGIPQL